MLLLNYSVPVIVVNYNQSIHPPPHIITTGQRGRNQRDLQIFLHNLYLIMVITGHWSHPSWCQVSPRQTKIISDDDMCCGVDLREQCWVSKQDHGIVNTEMLKPSEECGHQSQDICNPSNISTMISRLMLLAPAEWWWSCYTLMMNILMTQTITIRSESESSEDEQHNFSLHSDTHSWLNISSVSCLLLWCSPRKGGHSLDSWRRISSCC